MSERELAGYVAPIVRGTPERVLQRRVRTYDRTTGETTGEVTVREVLGGLVMARAVGLEVIEGVRPLECRRCLRPLPRRQGRGRARLECRKGEGCKRPVEIKRPARPEPKRVRGPKPEAALCAGGCGAYSGPAITKKLAAKRRANPAYVWRCRDCYEPPPTEQTACAGGCGKAPPSDAFWRANVTAREGAPWRCRECQPSRKKPTPMCPCGKAPAGKKSGMCGPCFMAKATKPPVTCITCDAVAKRIYLSGAQVRQRHGRPWQCWECAHGQPRPSELGRPKGWRSPRSPKAEAEAEARSIAAAQERVAARGAKKKG